MSNKEHVEALREVMEARGHGCVANWEAPSTKDALQAAIRALEAEDASAPALSADVGGEWPWRVPVDDANVADMRREHNKRHGLPVTDALESRYRALEEAAKEARIHLLQSFKADDLDVAHELSQALDALEER